MIRILHTADWHLGREFHGADLGPIHQRFFDWLAAEVERRRIDLLVMAGDVFDRALPPVSAVEMLNRELGRLAGLTRVVMITGNHDSATRLGHGPLLREAIHLRAGTERLGEPLLYEEGGFPLAIYPVPYLDPASSAPALGVEAAGHEAVLREAVARCAADLADRPGARSIAVGHAFVQGGEQSDSERSIEIGGTDRVPATVFDCFDYVALGHLHRPQGIRRPGAAEDEAPRIRYSGSPVPLSFSEVGPGLVKSVAVVELEADGAVAVELVPVPPAVGMARLRGTLEELLEDESFEAHREDWVEVTLTDRRRPDQPMERLRGRFEHVVSLRFESALSAESEGEAARLTEIARSNPIELIGSFVEHVRGEGPDRAETELLAEALDSRTGEEVRG